MSKVMRLPSAGARLGAPAGHHQAADHSPRGPRLLAAAGAVGGQTHAGKGRAGSGAGSGAGSDASQPRRLPASRTDDSTAVSPEGALFTPVPPTARLTPQANPSPLPSQASLSPVPSGLNYPLLSQVVLDPRDTCPHHHGALSCTRQGLPPGRGRSLGEDPPSAKAMSSHVGHGCEARAGQGPAWGRERKVDCLCTEGTRQRARPDGRDGHFRKPPRGPGDDLVTGRWTCQVSVKT